jgi:phospholipase/carboxylesterase
VLAGGILLRAMVPLSSHEQAGGLAGKRALIVSGARDPIARPANAARLKEMLEQAGADIEHRTLACGHELSPSDIEVARGWLQAVAFQAQESAVASASPV